MINRKAIATAAPLVLILAAPAAQAEIKYKFYGQVNQALQSVDTGAGSETYIVDNDNSGSRLGLKVSNDIGEGLKAGAHIELEYQSNASNKVTPEDKTVNGDVNERHIYAWVSGAFGKFAIGQGDGAANGNVERDLSGTQVIAYTNPALIGGDQVFVGSGGTNVALDKAMSDLDFESRYDRVRYDSPKFGPVKLAASFGVKDNNDVTELGARASFNVTGKLIAAVGMSTEDKADTAAGDEETVGGSISWLHTSGLNLTAAISSTTDDDPANPDADYSSFKVGYKTGKHALAVQFAKLDDLAKAGDTAESVQLAYVYKPTKKIEVYAGHNTSSLDRDGENFEDIEILTIGTRIKF